jgi:nucleoid-associated protein YgaU
MRSRNTLVWVGAAVSALVVAGASALYWTHPGFLWWNPAGAPVVARTPPESRPPTVPPATTAVEAAPAAAAGAPAAAAPGPGGKAQSEASDAQVDPAFDVVNVDPSGEAVIAGRSAPNAKVELRDGGKTVAEATADASGQFVIIPPAFAPGDHSLSLAASAGNARLATSSAVAVSIPAPKVALGTPSPDVKAAAPANATPADQAMRTVATTTAAPGARVAIQSIEADAAGALVARGSAEPNATVRVYLNQAAVADAKTQSDGRWSLTIRGGMTPGPYVMHVDEIGSADAAVIASAETPFDYPAASGPAPPAAASGGAGQPLALSAADPVVELVQTKRVVAGHTLWALSKTYYGDPTRYPVIVEANRAQIHNPNIIYPGQVFVVPKFEPKP